MAKVLGYMYSVVELAPKYDEQWQDVRRHIEYRDNIEDAQKILDVLNQTDINFSVYEIHARPVYERE